MKLILIPQTKKLLKKVEAITSITAVREKANLVTESPLNEKKLKMLRP